jgi:hypothetical protein
VIAQDVLRIAEKLRAASVQATEEAQAGSKVVSELAAGRDNLVELGLAAQDILQAASESELAAREAERGLSRSPVPQRSRRQPPPRHGGLRSSRQSHWKKARKPQKHWPK